MKLEHDRHEDCERYATALDTIREYLQNLVDRATDEFAFVDSLDNPYVGGAESIIDKYWQLILGCCTVRGSLEEAYANALPAPDEALLEERGTPPRTRVKLVSAPVEDCEDAVDEWLAGQNERVVEIVSVNTVPTGDTALATIVYRSFAEEVVG